MINNNTSMGLVITQESLSFALLAKAKGRPRLVKAGTIKTPEGAIADGNVVNPTKLAKGINRLLRSNRVSLHKAHISLAANPHLVQIIDLPLEIPGNLNKFVESEIKHSAILLGKAHQSDYCGLASKSADGGKRVIVSAVEYKKLAPLITALNLAKIEPLSIEPAAIARIRALYDKFVSTNYNCNVLFAMLNGSTITMTVFRKGTLDFIRTRQLPPASDISEYPTLFSNQITAIRQYYDIEISSFKDEQWAVVLDIKSDHVQIEQMTSYLNTQFDSVHICDRQDPASQTPIAPDSPAKCSSIAAIGMAMKEAANSKMNVKFDLVPAVEREKRAIRRWSFAAACISIAVISAIALIHNMMYIRLLQANTVIAGAKSNCKIDQISNLLRQEKGLEDQIADAVNNKKYIEGVFNFHQNHNWPAILSELAKTSPKDLCIMDLRQIGENTLVINGKVMAHVSAHQYAEKLSQSSLFESAVVSQMSIDQNYKGLVNYTIDCVIKVKEDENRDTQS